MLLHEPPSLPLARALLPPQTLSTSNYLTSNDFMSASAVRREKPKQEDQKPIVFVSFLFGEGGEISFRRVGFLRFFSQPTLLTTTKRKKNKLLHFPSQGSFFLASLPLINTLSLRLLAR